jgi:hypothetical protein
LKVVLATLATALAGFSLVAQDMKAPAKSAILHPEMTVEQGTYSKPMTTLGGQAR